MGMTENFEAMLASGQDSALLRYSLGSAYLKEGRLVEAVPHLREAVSQDAAYSAAWKALGKALAESGERDEAMATYRQGIEVAERAGDKQAAKEMAVFLKRLSKS
jgi:predicted Zn-dependent protease